MSGGKLSRRKFLGGLLGIAGVGAYTAIAGDGDRDPLRPAGPPYESWEGVRAQFGLDPRTIHLAGMLFTSHPAPVRDAIEAHRLGLDENPAGYVLENDRPLRVRAVEAAGAYFGAEPGCVALTDSTTMGLSILYQGLPLSYGDEVLSTTHDHYSTWYNLDLLKRRRGVSVRKVSLYEEPSTVSADSLVDGVISSIRPETKVVALTWVHSDTGVKLPIAAISKRLGEANRERPPKERILLCVDGVHGFGVEDEDMQSLGCDFFVAGCHKWLHGPRGTGIVVSRKESDWEGMVPLIPPFGVKDTQGLYFSPGGFHAFEHRWALTEAFEFQTAIGKARVRQRIHSLAQQLKEGLEAIPGVKVHTPMSSDLSAGIVGFDLEGVPRREVVARLRERGIVISQAPYGLHCLRATPGIANSPEEIDATLRALHAFRT